MWKFSPQSECRAGVALEVSLNLVNRIAQGWIGLSGSTDLVEQNGTKTLESVCEHANRSGGKARRWLDSPEPVDLPLCSHSLGLHMPVAASPRVTGPSISIPVPASTRRALSSPLRPLPQPGSDNPARVLPLPPTDPGRSASSSCTSSSCQWSWMTALSSLLSPRSR